MQTDSDPDTENDKNAAEETDDDPVPNDDVSTEAACERLLSMPKPDQKRPDEPPATILDASVRLARFRQQAKLVHERSRRGSLEAAAIE